MAEFAQYMTLAEKLPKYVFGALLLGVTASTFAVSLGRMRGTAIVGRSFDVTLSGQLGSNERLSALCVEAEVFFGDNQILPGRVSTVLAAGATAGEVLIRVRTSSAVDEPVVTVNVREGCLQKNTRKYVLLAEVLTGKAGDLAIGSGEVAGSAPVQLPAVGDQDGKITRPANPAFVAPSVTASLRKKAATDKTSSATPPDGAAQRLSGLSARLMAKAALESASKSSRSRLKLDPLELGAERDPVLRASSELLTQPSADVQQRAVAAALWQALNAQPQDMLRDSQRLKSLETDVARMLTQSRMTDKAVSDFRVQLEQSRSERFSNWLVYALAALLFLTWLTAAFLWTRSRREHGEESGSLWWRKGLGPDDKAAMNLAPQAMAGSAPDANFTHADLNNAGKFEPNFGLEGEDPLFDRRKGSSSVPPAGRFKTIEPIAAKERIEFSISLPSMTGMPRIVNAEELFDVQQQADFFVSLGDFDKAIEVLRHHIADNVETSALAYLDLFDLYHQLGRKVDYEILSEDFSHTFNAKVPAFDDYKSATQGLEFYSAALSRIVSLWPTPKVLEVIEESIFRKPDSRSEVFSLAAYRELLLLHAIAKRVVDPSGGRKSLERNAVSKAAMPDFANTNIQPLSAQLQGLPKLPPIGGKSADPTRPPASRHLGLDIDLSFDFIEPQVKQSDADSVESAKDAPLNFTHELLEFEVFPIDRSARK
jgi:hypothetical protein